ncbi:hypothetical protein [Natrialba sp. PRR66]|uniref:DUF7266 family protein n=1 Tax=Natrialba sp. PRR66 TaxID=3098146 RepID=UPI002B1DDA29|nr:hypothetical protein [Natrialba sp. PRR66]
MSFDSSSATHSLERSDTDRGMSIAVTHVLTIGITTILIALLLTSAGGLLDTETDRSAEHSLETIGERIAGEIESVDRLGDDTVTIRASHPRTVANSGYTVEIAENCEAPLLDGETDCVKLTSNGADTVVYVPVVVTELDIDESSAPGGTIEISADGNTLTIDGGNR